MRPAEPIGGLDVARGAPAMRVATNGRLRDVALVVGASLFVAAAAQVATPFPGSPVPVTAQTLALLLVGIALGARRGAAALALYLAEGLAGLPVFAAGGAGPAAFVGPTGGYLVAFPAAAFVAGALATPRSSTPRIVFASAASHAVIFLVGLAWLARFVGPERVFAMGLYPFLPGEAGKIAATAIALKGWGAARRARS
jgi:biotin transport system substrate-specific component